MMVRMGRYFLAAAMLVVMAGAAGGREFHVSPKGRPKARGTKAAPLDLASVLANQAGVKPGDIVWVAAGTYPAPQKDGKRVAFKCTLKGTKKNPIVVRGIPGKRVTIDGWLEIHGEHTWYWGFEIADSRYTEKTKAGAQASGCTSIFGPGTKLINCDIHDGSQGIGFWTPAVDAEVYGCIIHDFGWNDNDRGHGHAIYTQNEKGTKRIVDNIMFRGYGWNIHAYGEAGLVRGYRVEGNIAFAPGLRAPSQDPPDNFYFSTRNPCDRIAFISNVGYHPRGHTRRPNLRLGSGGKNGSLIVKDNYLAGMRGIRIANWKNMTITGNTVWATRTLVQFQTKPANRQPGGNWTVDRNTYIARADKACFSGATFADYRATWGFDRNSRLIEAEQPTANYIFVRPNTREAGRGHVAVFNWEGSDTVQVDLSKVLKKGGKFTVHNVQTGIYGKPVAEGVFKGRPVSLPMLKSDIAPRFDAFLVRTVK